MVSLALNPKIHFVSGTYLQIDRNITCLRTISGWVRVQVQRIGRVSCYIASALVWPGTETALMTSLAAHAK